MKAFYSSFVRAFALAVMFAVTYASSAQTPMFYKGGGTSSQTIPLKQGSQKTQLLIAPTDIAPSSATAGQINKIYFRSSEAVAPTATYTNFKVSFTQISQDTFTDNTYLTGLFVSLFEPLLVITPGPVDSWFEIALSNPFIFDPTKSLVVEIQYSGVTGTGTTAGISTRASTSLKRRISGTNQTATTGSLQGTQNDLGFDVVAAVPCSNPPVPGTAIASVSAPTCSGSLVTLSTTGSQTGTGVTFKWQSSNSETGPFADISSPSSSGTLNVNPTVKTYYRAGVSCSGGAFEYTTPILVDVKQPLSGTYIINSTQPTDIQTGGNNFQTFTDVANYLNCGSIAGPVTLNVASGTGPYTDQIALSAITGTSATNRIVINGNDVTVNVNTTDARHFIRLDGTDYVTIKRLNIVMTGSTGHGIQLKDTSNNIIIDSCTIDLTALTSTSATGSGGIVVSNSNTSTSSAAYTANSVFSNNTILGGYFGIVVTGKAGSNNNKIVANNIRNFYATGISVAENDGVLIHRNDVSRANRTGVTTFTGIELSGGTKNAEVSSNRIHDTHTSASTQTNVAYGIYTSSVDAPAGSENRYFNNVIYNFNSTSGGQYALYNSGSDGARYYHNSISLVHGASTGGVAYGFYQTTEASNIEVKNNNIHIGRSGTGVKTAIYLNTSTSTVISNYNNLYMAAPGTANTGYYNSVGYATLSAWQTATSQDVNSKSMDPLYSNASGGDLKPTNNALNNLGSFVGVTHDMDSVLRNTSTPDIGAYEFDAGPCATPPAGGTAIIASAGNPICAGSTVSLDLEGIVPGLNQTYTWQSSTTAAGTYTDVAAASGNPTYILNPTTTLYYRAAVTCSGNTSYSTAVLVTVQPAFAGGTYTINNGQPTGGTNFQSFADAVSAISCGVTSATVFNVTTGNYIEQVIIPEIPGASASKTITFNGNGAELSFTATNTMERATLKLNGADYIIIDSLNIVANGTTSSEYGFAVQLINDADHNIIRKSNIGATTTPATASSQNFAGLVISGSPSSATVAGSDCDSNLVENNIVTGGYHGITLLGSTIKPATGNKIVGNIVRDFYRNGIYLGNSDNILVEKNDVSRPARTGADAFYGIYITGATTNAMISKNIVRDPFKAATAATLGVFGIYMTAAAATPGNENYVVNNLIYDMRSGGAVTAFWNDNSSYTRYYHNTVSLDDPASTAVSTTLFTQGLVVLSSTNLHFKNNIVTIRRNDNTGKRIYTLPTTPTGYEINNNVVLIDAPGTQKFGTIGSTDYSSFADWTAANGGAYDQLSKNVDPLYTSPATGIFEPSNSVINNMGANVGITTDIEDSARLVATPDPGAFEFANQMCTAPATPGTTELSITTPVCAGTALTLNLNGHDVANGITYQWEASTGGGAFAPVSGVLTNPLYDFNAPTTTTSYRAAVVCSGVASYSNTVDVIVPVAVSGTFTINSGMATGGTNFQTMGDAINHIKCGINGPVVFNVEPSTTYTDKLIIPQIPGASATNTITFNGNGSYIVTTGTNAQRGGIILDGADYIIIDSLNVDVSGGSYGYGIIFTNHADNNIVRRSEITTVSTGTATSFAGIVFTGETGSVTAGEAGDNNLVENNKIRGGYYGIAVYGSITAGSQSVNNTVRNNTIENIYTYGIFVANQSGALISNNSISRPVRDASPTTMYGIYISGNTINSLFEKNRIFDMYSGNAASTGEFRAFYIGADGTAGNENRIINNLVYNIAHQGIATGIYNTGAAYNLVYHNTIVLDGSSSNNANSYGFYKTGTVDNVQVKNNIFYITRNSGGSNYGIYATTTAAGIVSNYNLVHLATMNPNQYFGYNGINRETLAQWQAATGQDANSKTGDPVFVDALSGNFTPSEATLDNKGTPVGVMDDIVGTTRSNSSPDFGAVEFGSILPVTGLWLKADNQETTVRLSWFTQAEFGNKGFEVLRSADGTSFLSIGYVASKAPQGISNQPLHYTFDDAAPLAGDIYYRLKQTDLNGKTTLSQVVTVKRVLQSFTIGKAYPNPATDVLYVPIRSTNNHKLQVVIVDITGRALLMQQYSVGQGSTNISMNTSGLTSGSYFLRLINEDGTVATQSFVK